MAAGLCLHDHCSPGKDLKPFDLPKMKWFKETSKMGQGQRGDTNRKKTTCLMGEFSGFFFFPVFSKFMFLFSSFLWSLHLSPVHMCARALFIWLCVSQFVCFFKELWICRWWAAPVPEAGPPHGRAGTRARPTAAERISVFKAFENKLLQFPGCRVGLTEGFLAAASPESRPQGVPCQAGREGRV